MTAFVDLKSCELARAIEADPDLVAHGAAPSRFNTTVTVSAHALAVLAERPADQDGYYDGTKLWIDGKGYRVTRTGGTQ